MIRRRRLLAARVAQWLVAALMAAACSRVGPAPSAAVLTGNLTIQAPASTQAGEAIAVTVSASSAADGTPVRLAVMGSYGLRLFQAAFAHSAASFALPAAVTQQAGLVTLTALSGQARGSATLMIQPGVPAEPLTALVGARSIVADGAHWSMVVVIPSDDYGNPMTDGTPMTLDVLHPDGQSQQQVVPVAHLAAWARVYSHTQAGRAQITVSSGAAHGPAATLLEVAGWPVTLTVSASPASLPADGESLAQLQTGALHDAFGNVMPDGTLVTFVVQPPGGAQRFVAAYTIDGVAEAPLQAANTPGDATVWADLYGLQSAPTTVHFTAGPATGAFPIRAQPDLAAGALNLTAGPLLGPQGQYVPDGSVVQFQLTDPAGQITYASAPASHGYAQVSVRLATLVAGSYNATASLGSGHGQIRFTYP